MRSQRSPVRGRIARTVRLLLVIGAAVAASAYALPAADASLAKPIGAPQLSAVSAAVARSGVDGIAWFNGTRLHSALGYMTPDEFETATNEDVIEQVA